MLVLRCGPFLLSWVSEAPTNLVDYSRPNSLDPLGQVYNVDFTLSSKVWVLVNFCNDQLLWPDPISPKNGHF